MTETLDYAIRDIHNGAAKEWAKIEVPCNAFCKPPMHCDLWYFQLEDESRLELDSYARALEMSVGMKVIRIERAMEAPLEIPKSYVGPGEITDEKLITAWLVFWEPI